ncbi:RDD family protein [Candidatus Poriferisocius sp.]|uniref:RDD family protein n=1 Tax=Candidatus Poriferisocius sp. TaxID=3101276 RepID=UPI003B01FF2F
MTDQPRPPEPGGDTSPADPGRGRKTPAKRVTLGTGDTMVLADYGQRFRARIGDGLIFSVGLAAAFVAIFTIAQPEWWWPLNDGSQRVLWSEELEAGSGIPITARVVVADVLFFLPFLYEIAAIAWRGKTLGMRIEAIRVVSIKTGQVPSTTAAILRGVLSVGLFLVFYGLAIPTSLGIGYGGSDPGLVDLGQYVPVLWWLLVHLSVFWGRDRRGWHDLIAGTVVVAAGPSGPADTPSGDTA